MISRFSSGAFLAVDLMSTLFKYPGQTAPVKMGPANARVRPAKRAKREKWKKKRGNSSRPEREGRRGREESARERSSPRDRSHFRGEETREERER